MNRRTFIKSCLSGLAAGFFGISGWIGIAEAAEISVADFGRLSDGSAVKLYTLTNAQGEQVKITDYGCRIQSWLVKDKNGDLRDIVLGYKDIESYEKDGATGMGAVIGRHANRIRYAKAEINGVEYHLEKNEGENHIHGGTHGFQNRIWSGSVTDNGVKFIITSPDGDAGYPGNMEASAAFDLTDDNELVISYEAVSDKDTICNMTNHSYFNLDGADAGSAMEQKMQIFADEITAIDKSLVPTGEIRKVKGTPMDFRKLTPMGARINDKYDQIVWGYDNNYIISGWKNDGRLRKAAYTVSDKSGITLTTMTTLPGVQFYSANYFEELPGKGGVCYNNREAFCLETQYFPNAFECKNFPQPVLKKGDVYRAKTVYKKGIVKN